MDRVLGVVRRVAVTRLPGRGLSPRQAGRLSAEEQATRHGEAGGAGVAGGVEILRSENAARTRPAMQPVGALDDHLVPETVGAVEQPVVFGPSRKGVL